MSRRSKTAANPSSAPAAVAARDKRPAPSPAARRLLLLAAAVEAAWIGLLAALALIP